MCTERVMVKLAFLGSLRSPHAQREKPLSDASFPLLIGKEMGTAGGHDRPLCIQGLSKTGQKTLLGFRGGERVLPGHHPPRLQDR